MNYFSSFDGLFWLLISLIVLIVLQRFLHREIQAFFLILTRRPGITQVIFALIFLPGVFLHELSHFVAAKFLGVHTGRFSLFPQVQPDGRLRLGYVETAPGGFLRDALIGVAPLITGSLVIAFVAINKLQLLPLWDIIRAADWNRVWETLRLVPVSPDFWLWFYLTFTISSMMMPSASDRQAWFPVFLLVVGLVSIAILAGAGSWMLENLAPLVNEFLRALALIFALSSSVHMLFIIPFAFLHIVLARVSGIDIGH